MPDTVTEKTCRATLVILAMKEHSNIAKSMLAEALGIFFQGCGERDIRLSASSPEETQGHAPAIYDIPAEHYVKIGTGIVRGFRGLTRHGEGTRDILVGSQHDGATRHYPGVDRWPGDIRVEFR